MTTNDEVIQQAANAVENYMRREKGWKDDAFQVEYKRKEGNALVFWALHVDDKLASSPGAGRSIEVYVDQTSGRILKELAFQ